MMPALTKWGKINDDDDHNDNNNDNDNNIKTKSISYQDALCHIPSSL